MFGRSVLLAGLLLSSPAMADLRVPLIHGADDIDAVCRVTYAEARSQGVLGKIGVIEVIMNRLRSGSYGGSVSAVVEQRAAFEPVLRVGGLWRNLPALSDREYDECRSLIDLKNGDDITRGATHFQNAAIVEARAKVGRVRPSAVNFGGMPVTADIGDHTFYAPAAALRGRTPGVKQAAVRELESDMFGDYDAELSGAGGS